MILNNPDFLGEFLLKISSRSERKMSCLILTFLDSITRQYDRAIRCDRWFLILVVEKIPERICWALFFFRKQCLNTKKTTKRASAKAKDDDRTVHGGQSQQTSQWLWANYSSLRGGHPKMWFSRGIPPKKCPTIQVSEFIRNLSRMIVDWNDSESPWKSAKQYISASSFKSCRVPGVLSHGHIAL